MTHSNWIDSMMSTIRPRRWTYYVPDPDAWVARFKPTLRCDPLTGEYLGPDAAHAVLKTPSTGDGDAELQKRTKAY